MDPIITPILAFLSAHALAGGLLTGAVAGSFLNFKDAIKALFNKQPSVSTGTSGNTLTSDGDAPVPSWQPPSTTDAPK